MLNLLQAPYPFRLGIGKLGTVLKKRRKVPNIDLAVFIKTGTLFFAQTGYDVINNKDRTDKYFCLNMLIIQSKHGFGYVMSI